MRHGHGLRKLNRTSEHRLAMLRNMMNSLIEHEVIKTTLPKAKELRRVVEPMITLAKEATVANRRLAFDRLRDRDSVVKLFNDLGGHAEGDRCLQRVAAAIRSALRSPDDIVVRYGGEEFVVILPAADRSEALAVAERLRGAVSDLQIPHPDPGTSAVVTVSIGACVAGPAENVLDTIERADKLLYSAKKGGRNRVSA